MNFFISFNRWCKSREIGVNFFRTKNFNLPKLLVVHKKRRLLYLPNNTTYIELFKDVILDDEYKLSLFKCENIINIVDVGANLGIFSIAARIAFKNANIHAYEPNPNNISVLGKHGKEFNFKIHEEALSFKAGRGELTFTTSHDTSARISNKDEGETILSDLDTVINRFKTRKIDLLKLDCEGAEFEILRNSNALKHVRFLTMEYHLPTKGSETVLEDLFSTIDRLNFKVMYHNRRNTCLGIIVAKNES
jgi:FkbM family methyltransferase